MLSKRPTEIERRLLRAMSRKWGSAKDFEAKTGLPWRVCARALKRMALRGDIEMEWHENYAEKYRLRRRPIYRAKSTMEMNGAPGWFVMAAGFAAREA